jgi:hypothetical protein
MAKITAPDQLNVGVELTVDTVANTFTLNEAGNLIYKDGVTLQALYSKFIKLWETATYNKYDFPMYVIDAKSGQFNFGTDGGTYNGWKPANDATRQALRDGGWNEYLGDGTLDKQYVGIVSLGDVSTSAQLYFQRTAIEAPQNFTFNDEVNEGILVYTDGGSDNRAYFKAFVREYAKKYKTSTLADTGQSGTGAYVVNVLLSNETDLKITHDDTTVSATAPYTGIDVTYYGTDQNKTIGAGSYPFRVVIDGNNATLEQIYEKCQYLLRQNSDIDAGVGTVTGKTANDLCYFVGDTLVTTQGVFIENIQSNDVNRIELYDQNNVKRTYPYVAAGTLNFNSYLSSGGSGVYIMYYADTVTGDYGTASAIIVKDGSAVDITGTITGDSLGFTFDYDGNTQGGRTPATDAAVVIFALNKGVSKPVVATGTISRAKGLSFSLVAEADRAYLA